MVRLSAFAVLGGLLMIMGTLRGEDPVFSGPQVGEPMPAFKVRGVLDDDAGRELDFISLANGKPIVLVFVHDANRLSISMTRVLTGYTVSRKKDGLHTGVVWLSEDATAAENSVKRVKHALTPDAPTGVFADGSEGPGSYGLNRKVTLTILIGKEGRVTANFALIQPSLQADLPKILAEITRLVGGRVPSLKDLPGMPVMMQSTNEKAAMLDGKLRELIRPVIRKSATDEDVDLAAKKVEDFAEKNDEARAEIGRIALTIVNSDKLANYGTEHAQGYLKKWAKAYGPYFEKSRTDKAEKKSQEFSDSK